jgi:hypothetical protein
MRMPGARAALVEWGLLLCRAALYCIKVKLFDHVAPLLKICLVVCQDLLPAVNHSTIEVIRLTAVALYRQERLAEAEAFQRQVRAICRRLFGEEHIRTLRSMFVLAATLSQQMRWEEAERLFVQTKEICVRVLVKGHPLMVKVMATLALLYCSQARPQEAEELALHAKSLGTRSHRVTSEALGESEIALTIIHAERNGLQMSIEVARSFLGLFVSSCGSNHPSTPMAMAFVAECLGNQGLVTEFTEILERLREGSGRGSSLIRRR